MHLPIPHFFYLYTKYCIHLWVFHLTDLLGHKGEYLETVLKTRGLVLCVLGDGCVAAVTDACPDPLSRILLVPVLVRRLLHLRPHLYRVVRISLHQWLCRKQPQVLTKRYCVNLRNIEQNFSYKKQLLITMKAKWT